MLSNVIWWHMSRSGSVDWDFPTNVLDVVMMGRYELWVVSPAGKVDHQRAEEALV